MKDFRPNNNFGGGSGGGNRGGDRGGFRGGGGGNFGKRGFDGPKQMFDAICAKCGKPCQVPFRPNGERPVFCRDCFGDSKPQGQGQQNNFPRNDFQRRESTASPVFKPDNSGAQIADIKRQLDAIHAKLDRLLQRADGFKKETVSNATEKPSLGQMVSDTQKTSPKEKTTKKGAGKKRILKKK